MVTTTSAQSYTATTDGEHYYVQDQAGVFLRDFRDLIAIFETSEDAHEVAAAHTEGRPVRPWSYRPAAAKPAPVWDFPQVTYRGSLIEYRGATFKAEACWCRDECNGFELSGEVRGRWVEIQHSRRTSFEPLAD